MRKLYNAAVEDAKRRCPTISGYKYENLDTYARSKLLEYIQLIHPECSGIEEALISYPDLFNDENLLAGTAMFALRKR